MRTYTQYLTTIHANQTQVIIPALQVIEVQLGKILQFIASIEARDLKAVRVRFRVPTHRTLQGKAIKMATSLINDVISNIPLEFDNVAGRPVPTPSGGTITLGVVDSAGAPSTVAMVAMGADGTSVDVTPTPADGLNTGTFVIMFEDMATADLKAQLECVFTADTSAANVHFDTTHITTRPTTGP